MDTPEITIRELPRGNGFVAILPGSERIGPTVRTREEAEAQVEAYLNPDASEPTKSSAPPSAGETGSNEESGPAATDSSPGYHVEESPGWYKLIGPDREQVGKSTRSREDAEAQIPVG